MAKQFPLKILLSLLVALSGILYELVFAQFLSAILGGTLLQYSLTIGIFTFALGIASLFYPNLPQRWKTIQALAWLQIIVCLVAALCGLALNQTLRAQEISEISYPFLAYFPVFMVGLLTGFELPILMEAGDHRDRSYLLGADYIGMFLGTLIFPIFLLPSLGVNGALAASVGINLFAALLSFWAVRRRGIS